MNDTPKLEGALTLVLKSDELHDLVSEYAEIGVDAMLESGALRDIQRSDRRGGARDDPVSLPKRSE